MKVIERLQRLANEDYHVVHRSLGRVQLDKNDLIRIRQVNKDKVFEIKFGQVKGYHNFVHAERVNKDDYTQGMDLELLNKKIIHQEVWMLGSDCALDMYVKEL